MFQKRSKPSQLQYNVQFKSRVDALQYSEIIKQCGGSFFVRKPNPQIYILGEKFLLKLKIDAPTNKPITCNSQKMASTESNDSTAYMDHTEEVFSSV